MDNFQMDVTAEDRKTLLQLLEIAFRHNCPGGKASHWAEIDTVFEDGWSGSQPRKVLILYWSPPESDQKAIRLPSACDAIKASNYVEDWLDAVDYGPEPDHDGDNGKGFRLFCDFWGHVNGSHYSIIGISPAWAMYGK